MKKEKERTFIDKVVDFMEQYPESFIPRVEIQERLEINSNTLRSLINRAYLYGLVEKTGTPHYPKYRLIERNKEKWKIIYKQPTKEYMEFLKNKSKTTKVDPRKFYIEEIIKRNIKARENLNKRR